MVSGTHTSKLGEWARPILPSAKMSTSRCTTRGLRATRRASLAPPNNQRNWRGAWSRSRRIAFALLSIGGGGRPLHQDRPAHSVIVRIQLVVVGARLFPLLHDRGHAGARLHL